MIEVIKDVPANVAGFRASGEVTADDYKNVMEPHVKQLVEKTGELNFLYVVDTDVANFTAGAWLRDILLGIKQLAKWRRGAIITHQQGAIKFTDAFSIIAPGEFKGFHPEEYNEAVGWVSGNSEA